MSSGSEAFYLNVAKARGVINRSRIGQSIMKHPLRYTAGAGAVGMAAGRASGSGGLQGRSSGGY